MAWQVSTKANENRIISDYPSARTYCLSGFMVFGSWPERACIQLVTNIVQYLSVKKGKGTNERNINDSNE